MHRTLARPSSASKASERVAIGELFVRAAGGGRREDFFHNLRQVNKNSKLSKASNASPGGQGIRGSFWPPPVLPPSTSNGAKARWRPSSPCNRSEARASSLPQRSVRSNHGVASPRSPQMKSLLPASSRPLLTRHLLPSSALEAKGNGTNSEGALDYSPKTPDKAAITATLNKHSSPRPIQNANAHPHSLSSSQPLTNGSCRSHSQPHVSSAEKAPKKRVTWSEECKVPAPTSMLALLRGISGDSSPPKPHTPPSPKGVLARAAEASIGSRICVDRKSVV